MPTRSWAKYPQLDPEGPTGRWLSMLANLGHAANTLDAYARGLANYVSFCAGLGCDPLTATREQVARWVRQLVARPSPYAHEMAGTRVAGLSNATVQQRLTAVRLWYDFLIEERLRASTVNPVGRGSYAPGGIGARGTPGGSLGHERGRTQRGLLPRFHRLPWVPTEAQWATIVRAACTRSVRTHAMLALGYDCALRREELVRLTLDDLIDPSARLLRPPLVKRTRERTVPYSAECAQVLKSYLALRRRMTRGDGALFLSLSPRNYGRPITVATWSKEVELLAALADVPRLSTHTLRHLRLTDLARAGWDALSIAAFAGHRRIDTTLAYIQLSGRELQEKLTEGMRAIHVWRGEMMLAEFGAASHHTLTPPARASQAAGGV